MILEINTNGAWRTVLHGLSLDVDDPRTSEVLLAAATIAAFSAETDRKPISWRSVYEDGSTIARCVGADGWKFVEGA